jgi:hypothetical protein
MGIEEAFKITPIWTKPLPGSPKCPKLMIFAE